MSSNIQNKKDLEQTAFETAFKTLKEGSLPTKAQKSKMLTHIMNECESENDSMLTKLKEFIITYPWRFAFTLSAMQAIIGTVCFGSRYTHLILSCFVG